ncbi:C4-dicarboxylate TRAP transporter small permease protein DctQ [bioreactor metagenome]|uniref:C4-dicarboxylate TRAP transporter small permease protein DctQ n=1 Tax=bioreactor metagenome TaxID=1076179 RepID=A0A645J7A8_9ZZZZ
MFIWASVLGAAVGIHEHIHIGIDVVVNHFPLPLRTVVRVIVQVAIIIMCLILIIFGMKMVGMTAKQISPALHLPMKYVYLAAPVGGVFMIIYLLEGIYLDIKKGKEGKSPC